MTPVPSHGALHHNISSLSRSSTIAQDVKAIQTTVCPNLHIDIIMNPKSITWESFYFMLISSFFFAKKLNIQNGGASRSRGCQIWFKWFWTFSKWTMIYSAVDEMKRVAQAEYDLNNGHQSWRFLFRMALVVVRLNWPPFLHSIIINI